MCHNPSNTDAATRATATVAARQSAAAAGNQLQPAGASHSLRPQRRGGRRQEPVRRGRLRREPSTISRRLCFRRSVRPGRPASTQNCSICHTTSSEQNLPLGMNPVVDPQGWINPNQASCGRLQRLPHVGGRSVPLPRQHDVARRELHGLPQLRRGLCGRPGSRAVLDAEPIMNRPVNRARRCCHRSFFVAVCAGAEERAVRSTAACGGSRRRTSAPRSAEPVTKTSARHSQEPARGGRDRATSTASRAKPANPATGPGSKHVETLSAADIRNPAKISAAEMDQTCLTCHRNQPTNAGRLEASHAHNAIACTSCHSVMHAHGPGRTGRAQARRSQRALRELPYRRESVVRAALQTPRSGKRDDLRRLPQSARQLRNRP